jgi:hypothetical protein
VAYFLLVLAVSGRRASQRLRQDRCGFVRCRQSNLPLSDPAAAW